MISDCSLGTPIPSGNLHALSVWLPTWADIVGWARGDSRVVNAMQCGYPRFFVARNIEKLGKLCLEKFRITHDLFMAFPTSRLADECISFLERQPGCEDVTRTSVIFLDANDSSKNLGLHLVVYTHPLRKFAKAFWQHTGTGISTRYADACLSLLPYDVVLWQASLDVDPFRYAQSEKRRLRERIATLVAHGDQASVDVFNSSPLPAEHDVYLYPTGMSAIWHVHQSILSLWPKEKSVCFGFPYIDTIKVLEKWGPGCYFYGDHPDANLVALEALLATFPGSVPGSISPISAVFCECPSNPLLYSPNLLQLRRLADEYGFIIVMDETVGTFVNINVLPYADVVVTSLSKLFSGKADVMGGSLVLNPCLPHYAALKTYFQKSYVDLYYPADAVVMESNSRDFASRVRITNKNTKAACHYLRSRALSFAGYATPALAPSLAIKDVFYPEWVTRANYDICRRPGKEDNFGPLFSLTFTTIVASIAFYNALACAKGPSLGTNFTLSCPYTLLAHYHELEWASRYGVEEGIVRVSVGMEDQTVLMGWLEKAIQAAEATVK